MNLPPEKLMRRVGWYFGAERPGEVFARRGEEQWRFIDTVLRQSGVSLSGASVLDFGCGVGRILRPAVHEHPAAGFWGCDIDAACVRWLAGDLGARARIFQTAEWPPLPVADECFDAVYAFSVFTHLVDSWSAWLVELHRVLKPGGLLIVTVDGPGLSSFQGHPLAEASTGMNVVELLDPWGPWVLHSEWWLRAHWGRAFEITQLLAADPSWPPPLYDQAAVVMRKRAVALTPAELERLEPDEPREYASVQENVHQLCRELQHHSALYTSASWRITAPLRIAGRLARTKLHRPSTNGG